jgi:hypothetical protein
MFQTVDTCSFFDDEALDLHQSANPRKEEPRLALNSGGVATSTDVDPTGLLSRPRPMW